MVSKTIYNDIPPRLIMTNKRCFNGYNKVTLDIIQNHK